MYIPLILDLILLLLFAGNVFYTDNMNANIRQIGIIPIRSELRLYLHYFSLHASLSIGSAIASVRKNRAFIQQ